MDTVVVFVCDSNYFVKTRRSIIDLRSIGNWKGPIVVISIDFGIGDNFKRFYNITEIHFPNIDKSNLLQNIQQGFSNSDKREIRLINQWEKLHVFDEYFKQWKRVIYFDSGLRILDDIQHLLDLDYHYSILAPIDGKYSNPTPFHTQLSHDYPDRIEKIKQDFGDIFNNIQFLNCIWVYDTAILEIVNKQVLIDAMNTYFCCKTNEMAIMNLILNFKYDLWRPFPIYNNYGKYLFEWSESNNPGSNWTQYCFIKYPSTILMTDC
jgi:hypothetical protein